MNYHYEYICHSNGKGLNVGDLKTILHKSYDKKQSNHNDFIIDRNLSGRRAQVYHNPKTNQVVISHRGTDSLQDWLTNLRVGLLNDKSSERFKHAKRIQDEAHKKYGDKEYVTVGHSLGKNIAETVANKNDEVIGYNGYTTPYDLLKKENKKHHNVRTSKDVASALLTVNNNNLTTIKSRTNDILTNHNIDQLDYLDQNKLIGGKINKKPLKQK
jgi:hypothetical protein